MKTRNYVEIATPTPQQNLISQNIFNWIRNEDEEVESESEIFREHFRLRAVFCWLDLSKQDNFHHSGKIVTSEKYRNKPSSSPRTSESSQDSCTVRAQFEHIPFRRWCSTFFIFYCCDFFFVRCKWLRPRAKCHVSASFYSLSALWLEIRIVSLASSLRAIKGNFEVSRASKKRKKVSTCRVCARSCPLYSIFGVFVDLLFSSLHPASSMKVKWNFSFLSSASPSLFFFFCAPTISFPIQPRRRCVSSMFVESGALLS